MHCPFCNHDELKVTDSRNATEANAIRRRRECLRCLRRFTTFETIDVTIQVLKRDGRYEDFHQEKLIQGMQAACCHTKISFEQIRTIASQITNLLIDRGMREIRSLELGEMVMRHLKSLDTIAYIRFACIYRRFKDVDELKDAIDRIQGEDCLQKEGRICH